jgi:DNA-binding transcriptional MocR family regulator
LTPVPLAEEGWDVAAIEAAAREHRPSLAYLMPDFHNPTGLVMDARARRRAVRGLQRAGSVVVIDETFAELNLDGAEMPPPAASFADEPTITIGSLSKTVWGGLRIGWVRAEPSVIHRLVTERARTDMASPLFEQLVATRTLERLDEILAERREVIRIRRAALTRALEERLPAWRFTSPSGGLFLWVELPGPISTSLSLAAGRRGLQLTPGARFAAAGLLERNLRLPFTLPAEALERAVAILAEIVPGEIAEAPRYALEYVA